MTFQKVWIRTCQECGTEQEIKPPQEYKNDTWRNKKCKRCKSIALDYGTFISLDEDLDELEE